MTNIYLNGSIKDRTKSQKKIRNQVKKALKNAKYKNVIRERKNIIKQNKENPSHLNQNNNVRVNINNFTRKISVLNLNVLRVVVVWTLQHSSNKKSLIRMKT